MDSRAFLDSEAAAARTRAAGLAWPAVSLIVLFMAGISLLVHDRYHNADVSWLITAAEGVLQGKVLYKDILETNPPAAVLLYLIPSRIAAWLHFMAEDAVTLQTYLVAFVSLALTSRVLPNTINGMANARLWLFMVMAAGVLILPMHGFAQREHYAVMLSLPMVANFIRFAEVGSWARGWQSWAIVLLASLPLALKPIFALPGVLLLAHALVHARSWRPMLDSGIVHAGLIGTGLTVTLVWGFPHYLEIVVPILRDIYVPARSDFMAILLGEHVFVAGLAAIIISIGLAGVARPTEGVVSMILAAAGFLAGYVIQGKGFPYHAYPALFYGICALCILILARLTDVSRGGGSVRLTVTIYSIVLAIIAGAATKDLAWRRQPMTDLAWAGELDRPTVMMISKEIQIAFPLIRKIGGQWVDPANGQWMVFYSAFMLRRAGEDRGLQEAIQVIEREKPDLILIDMSPYMAWLREAFESARPGLLSGYSPVAEERYIRVMRRNQ
jgi:hypothetical protein